MSKDIREMIDKVKNFKQIIKEESFNPKFQIHDIVFIKVNGQWENKPREIHQHNGKQYVVSGHIKRDDGKGFSSQGGGYAMEDDIKLAN
jgi:hypothetical protein